MVEWFCICKPVIDFAKILFSSSELAKQLANISSI